MLSGYKHWHVDTPAALIFRPGHSSHSGELYGRPDSRVRGQRYARQDFSETIPYPCSLVDAGLCRSGYSVYGPRWLVLEAVSRSHVAARHSYAPSVAWNVPRCALSFPCWLALHNSPQGSEPTASYFFLAFLTLVALVYQGSLGGKMVFP